MSDDQEGFKFAGPQTVLGQLQRGRGLGARRVLNEPGAEELVIGCVLQDVRWDAQTESRDEYLAVLIHRLGLSLDSMSEHLFAGAGRAGLRDVELSLQVLAWLVELGRLDAVPILRRYAVEGTYWETALDAIWDWEVPDLWDGLDRQILARLDDDQLAEAVSDWGSWPIWARSHERVRVILEDSARARSNRPEPESIKALSSEILLHRITTGGRRSHWQDLLVLAGRGEVALLDLAEDAELRTRGLIPSISAALRKLGGPAVARARDWSTGGDPELHRLGVDVLAAHGDRNDVPVLMDAMSTALAEQDWCGLEAPAKGLGRLAVVEASGLLLQAWESTVHSYARAALFQGLTGCLPTGMDDVAVEGLDDCEFAVQEMACFKAPAIPFVIERLREWQTGPTSSDRRECAAIRLETV